LQEGDVAGGSILQGVLRAGFEIELRPGIVVTKQDGDGNTNIYSRIFLPFMPNRMICNLPLHPGGRIGLGDHMTVHIDPILTRADYVLVGQVLGLRDQLPDVHCENEISF
jgi:translation initiation factor 2 gamma subunit (eIF-2gamma)